MQFRLALAGALTGWQYGLIRAVSPLAEAEDAKDLLFDAEVEGIRAAAAARAKADADASAVVAGGGGGAADGKGGPVVASGGEKKTKERELVA